MDVSQLSTHSLRRGGATCMRMSGASLQAIQERADWKSGAVHEYLKLSVTEWLSVDMRVALCLDTF